MKIKQNDRILISKIVSRRHCDYTHILDVKFTSKFLDIRRRRYDYFQILDVKLAS